MKSLVISVLLALFLVFPAQACLDLSKPSSPPPVPFFERIRPALDLTKVKEKRIYLRFSGTIQELNELMNRGSVASTNGAGKEPVFGSFQAAQSSVGPDVTYIVGVDRVTGEVFEVSTVSGRRLEQFYAKGCGGSSWE